MSTEGLGSLDIVREIDKNCRNGKFGGLLLKSFDNACRDEVSRFFSGGPCGQDIQNSARKKSFTGTYSVQGKTVVIRSVHFALVPATQICTG